MGQSRPLFVYFCLFHITQFNKLMKALIMCLGLEPGATGWNAQMNPLSYGSTFSFLSMTFTDYSMIPWTLVCENRNKSKWKSIESTFRPHENLRSQRWPQRRWWWLCWWRSILTRPWARSGSIPPWPRGVPWRVRRSGNLQTRRKTNCSRATTTRRYPIKKTFFFVHNSASLKVVKNLTIFKQDFF